MECLGAAERGGAFDEAAAGAAEHGLAADDDVAAWPPVLPPVSRPVPCTLHRWPLVLPPVSRKMHAPLWPFSRRQR